MKTEIIKTATLTLLLTGIVTLTYGQVSQGGTPYSFDRAIKTKQEKSIISKENLVKSTMSKVSQTQIDSIKQKNENEDQVYQFAYSFDVNIDLKTESTVDTLDIGVLYRYKIESEGAYSINVIFSEYEVPRGAKVFIYSVEQNHVIGAFTSDNNKASKILPTIPVKGDKIIIEYFEPLSPDYEGKLTIGKIGHDFTDVSNTLRNNNFGNSGDCHVDINCQEGDNWQNQKRSVLQVMYDGDRIGTGVLMNNTNQDGRAYVLTAHHVLCNQNGIDGSVFIFNYESPSCNGSDGSISQSISGGTFRATRADTDFTLIELSKMPLSTYGVFYAGWDRNDVQGSGGVGIHHPAGDVKKISTYSMAPLDSDCFDVDCSICCESDFLSNDNFYQVNWVATANGHGITERGSSGSPLFNNQGRVIGQLFGTGLCDRPFCDDPQNHKSNYGKIFSSWDGTDKSQRLRDWLNPENDLFVLEGINGCGQGIAGMTVNLNITHTISGGIVELHQVTNNITASNRIEADAMATYEAGNSIELEPGFRAEEGSSFKARIVDYNCAITCDPINVVAWTGLICSGSDLCFAVTNANAYNVNITTISGSSIFQSSGSFSSSPVCVGVIPSDVGTGTYVATVSFSNDCHEISNTYQFSVISCKNSSDGNSDSEEEKFARSISDTTRLDFNFAVFPNPNDGDFSIKIPNGITMPYSLEIINSAGKIMYSIEHINANRVNVNQTGLTSGAYFIRIKSANRIASQKFIIQ